MPKELLRCINHNCKHQSECKHGQLELRTLAMFPDEQERFKSERYSNVRTINPVRSFAKGGRMLNKHMEKPKQ